MSDGGYLVGAEKSLTNVSDRLQTKNLPYISFERPERKNRRTRRHNQNLLVVAQEFRNETVNSSSIDVLPVLKADDNNTVNTLKSGNAIMKRLNTGSNAKNLNQTQTCGVERKQSINKSQSLSSIFDNSVWLSKVQKEETNLIKKSYSYSSSYSIFEREDILANASLQIKTFGCNVPVADNDLVSKESGNVMIKARKSCPPSASSSNAVTPSPFLVFGYPSRNARNTYSSEVSNKSEDSNRKVITKASQESYRTPQRPKNNLVKSALPNSFNHLIDLFSARRHKSEIHLNKSYSPLPNTSFIATKDQNNKLLKMSSFSESNFLNKECKEQAPLSTQNLRGSFRWRSIFTSQKTHPDVKRSSSANVSISSVPSNKENTRLGEIKLSKEGQSFKFVRKGTQDLKKKCSFSSTCSGSSDVTPMETVFENECLEGCNILHDAIFSGSKVGDEPRFDDNSMWHVKIRECKVCKITNPTGVYSARPFSVIGSTESGIHDERNQMQRRLQMQNLYRVKNEDSCKLDDFMLNRGICDKKPSLEKSFIDVEIPYLNIMNDRLSTISLKKHDRSFSIVDYSESPVTSIATKKRRRARDSVVGRSTVAVTASTLRRRKLSQYKHCPNGSNIVHRRSITAQLLPSSVPQISSHLQDQHLSKNAELKLEPNPLLKSKRQAKAYSTSSIRQMLYFRGDNRTPIKKLSKVSAMEAPAEKRLEKERKGDTKTNSVILASLWSIRQRKKKDNNRSLASLFGSKQLTDAQPFQWGLDEGLPENDRKNGNKFNESNVEDEKEMDSSNITHSSIYGSRKASTDESELLRIMESLPRPEKLKGIWNSLDLWLNLAGCFEKWTGIDPSSFNSLSSSEKKRMNVIFELIETELHHCQVLVFMQHIYLRRLIKIGILDKEIATLLIPNVLTDLIEFHVNITRRLREICVKNTILEDISEIIIDEFGNGNLRNKAVKCYTEFCLAHERSCKIFNDLMQQSANFRGFFNFFESDGNYKGRDFKSCMLLILQRPTKYPILFEQINKHYTTIRERKRSELALAAVKKFTQQIDLNKMEIELQNQWDEIRRIVPRIGGTMLGCHFTFDDMVDPFSWADAEGGFRRIHYICTAFYQKIKNGQKIEIQVILFDDLVVFLSVKNTSASNLNIVRHDYYSGITLAFFSIDGHSAAIPLQLMLIREMPRTNEVMIVIAAKAKSDMFRLMFNNKSQLQNFVREINLAREKAPPYVRLAKGEYLMIDKTTMVSHNGENDIGSEEIEHKKQFDKWLTSLEDLFDEQKKREDELSNYIAGRMAFSDALRSLIENFPVRPHSAFTFTNDSSPVAIAAKAREIRDVEKLKKTWRTLFSELERHQYTGLASLINKASMMRDSDLPSIFDDLHDLSLIPVQQSSTSSNGESDSSSTASELSYNTKNEKIAHVLASVSSKNKRPKCPQRARTYHGKAICGKPDMSIRRHTTLPLNIGEINDSQSTDNGSNFQSKTVKDEFNKRIQKLPLKNGSKAHKIATEIIQEIVNLRVDNNKLRADAALRELYITSLLSKKAPMAETAEKIESLRLRLDELSIKEREFKMEFERKQDLLKSQYEALNKERADLEQKKMIVDDLFDNFKQSEVEFTLRETNLCSKEELLNSLLGSFNNEQSFCEHSLISNSKNGYHSSTPGSLSEKKKGATGEINLNESFQGTHPLIRTQVQNQGEIRGSLVSSPLTDCNHVQNPEQLAFTPDFIPEQMIGDGACLCSAHLRSGSVVNECSNLSIGKHQTTLPLIASSSTLGVSSTPSQNELPLHLVSKTKKKK